MGFSKADESRPGQAAWGAAGGCKGVENLTVPKSGGWVPERFDRNF